MVMMWNCLDYVTTVILLTSDLKREEMIIFSGQQSHTLTRRQFRPAGRSCVSVPTRHVAGDI